MRKGILAPTLALSLLPAAAFAVEIVGVSNDGKDPIVALSFESLKEQCLQLEHEVKHGQLKPFTIELNCKRERTFWLSENQNLNLQETITFSGDGTVKGRYVVNSLAGTPINSEKQAECPIFREWRAESFKETIRLTTCDELLAIKSLSSYCETQLGQGELTESDPQPTGRVIDTCNQGGPQVQQEQQQEQQQQGQEQGQEQGQQQGQQQGQEQPGKGGKEVGQQGQGTTGQGQQGQTQEQWIRSSFGASVSPVIISAGGYRYQGLEVTTIEDYRGLAARLGLRPGIIVVKVNAVNTATPQDLIQVLSRQGFAQTGLQVVAFDRSSNRWVQFRGR